MKLEAVTQDLPFFSGTLHWGGTINGRPAIIVTYYGGASLWIHNGKWTRLIKAKSLPELEEAVGL